MDERLPAACDRANLLLETIDTLPTIVPASSKILESTTVGKYYKDLFHYFLVLVERIQEELGGDDRRFYCDYGLEVLADSGFDSQLASEPIQSVRNRTKTLKNMLEFRSEQLPESSTNREAGAIAEDCKAFIAYVRSLASGLVAELDNLVDSDVPLDNHATPSPPRVPAATDEFFELARSPPPISAPGATADVVTVPTDDSSSSTASSAKPTRKKAKTVRTPTPTAEQKPPITYSRSSKRKKPMQGRPIIDPFKDCINNGDDEGGMRRGRSENAGSQDVVVVDK